MPPSPVPLRAARAAMFAAVAAALGAVGHSYMSGTDIPALGLLSAFGLTGGLAWLGAGRRRGPLSIGSALLGVQAVLHLVFSASTDAGAMGSAGSMGHMGSMGAAGTHDMDAMDMSSGMDMASGMDMGMDMGAAMAGHAHDGLGMIAAHVLAGLFCAAWLAWGEAAVFRLAAVLAVGALLAARPLSRVLALLRTRVAPVPPRPALRPRYERPRTLRGAVHAHTAERRGPPRPARIRITAPGRPVRA
ncbi:hypothetical protein [Streptomyces sp. NBC_00503]|uniref:hypothetical protein n=1 Tax=Streptomyces sp. NBC_00503 TaxID=2903659 RepID=UPI002E800125|nr:hypothetical protein [Streptomyces sp. NBC_00503]WUD81030.1 hypothetical protein OG490_10990 [Streptomyces sp. NBC_00503]